jgi:hypothetical protein
MVDGGNIIIAIRDIGKNHMAIIRHNFTESKERLIELFEKIVKKVKERRSHRKKSTNFFAMSSVV